MSKQFLAIIAVIILAFVGVIAFSGNKSDQNTSKADATKVTEHIKGNPNATVTLVEYGDFQCPYCQQYEPTVQQVVKKYENDIKFQFRNFPLFNIHPNAFAAARAAEAAGLQNKFWEMHDVLYQQSNWQIWTQAKDPNPAFENLAEQLKLNMTQYKKDFASSKVNDAVNADKEAGNKLGVTGTPTFFLNGKKIEVSNDPSSFEKVIDAALAKNKSSSAPETSAGTTSQTSAQ